MHCDMLDLCDHLLKNTHILIEALYFYNSVFCTCFVDIIFYIKCTVNLDMNHIYHSCTLTWWSLYLNYFWVTVVWQSGLNKDGIRMTKMALSLPHTFMFSWILDKALKEEGWALKYAFGMVVVKLYSFLLRYFASTPFLHREFTNSVIVPVYRAILALIMLHMSTITGHLHWHTVSLF